jgi:hypothetical protein
VLPFPKYFAALATLIKLSVPLNEFLNIDALRAKLIDLMRPQNILSWHRFKRAVTNAASNSFGLFGEDQAIILSHLVQLAEHVSILDQK